MIIRITKRINSLKVKTKTCFCELVYYAKTNKRKIN